MFPLPPVRRVDCGPIVLVMHGPDDAAAVADAINESLEHLRPWMAWAQRETTVAEQAMRLAVGVERAEAGGGDWSYSIVEGATGAIAGGCGLHQRVGDGTLDIGYWLHVDFTGRGFVTHAAAALTHVAFEALSCMSVRITCDEANVASAAVPRRLGFAHVDTIHEDPQAPAERARTMVWVLARDNWSKSHAATFSVSYDL